MLNLNFVQRIFTLFSMVLISMGSNAGQVDLDSTNLNFFENAGTYNILLIRSGDTSTAATVDYVISDNTTSAGSDYTAALSGQVSWAAGDNLAKMVPVVLIDDAVYEGDETFSVTLSNPLSPETIGMGSLTYTIMDNDPIDDKVSLSQAVYSVAEGAGNIVITINRLVADSDPISVDYTVSSGSATAGADFTVTSGTASWGVEEGNPDKTFSIPILDDSIFEGDETFKVTLSNPIGGASLGANSSADITITDNDAIVDSVGFLSGSSNISESEGSINIKVNRPGPAVGALTVDYATSNLTASSGVDYTAVSGRLFWADGDTVDQTITVPIINNTVSFASRDFQVDLSNPVSSISANVTFTLMNHIVTITDSDVDDVGFSTASSSVSEAAETVSVSVSRASTTVGSLTVDYDLVAAGAIEGVDYIDTNGQLFWSDGDGSDKQIQITLLDNTTVDATRNIQINLSNPVNGSGAVTALLSATHNITINDDDISSLGFSVASSSVSEDEGSIDILVSRPGSSSGNVTVDYALQGVTAEAGVDYIDIFGQLSWGDGDTADKVITVTLINNDIIDVSRNVQVQLSNPISSLGLTVELLTVTHDLTINDDDALTNTLSLSNDSFSVLEADGAVVLEVNRSGVGVGNASIAFTTSDGTAIAGEDYQRRSGTLSWADGDLDAKSISIPIFFDAREEEIEDFTVEFSSVQGNITLAGASTVTISIVNSTKDISNTPGLDNNQRETATWVDSTCTVNDSLESDLEQVCNGLRDINNSDDEVKRALDAINPEELTKLGANSRQVGTLQHQNLEKRFTTIHRGQGRGVDLSGLNLNLEGQVIPGFVLNEMLSGALGGAAGDEVVTDWGIFVNGNLKFGGKDASDINTGYEFEILGLTLGADYRINDQLVVGGSLGYGVSDVDYGNDSGGMDTDSLSGSMFTSYYHPSGAYLDGLVNYAQDNYDSVRRIQYEVASDSVDRTAQGTTDGDQVSVGINSGYDFNFGGWTMGPHLNMYYLDVSVDVMAETGAGSLNTVVKNNDSQSFTATLGGHFSYAWNHDWGVLIPYLRLDYVREFIDDAEVLEVRFIDDPNVLEPVAPIYLTTDRPEANYATWAIGASGQFTHGISGFLEYQSTEGYTGLTVHDISAGIRMERSF